METTIITANSGNFAVPIEFLFWGVAVIIGILTTGAIAESLFNIFKLRRGNSSSNS